MAALSKVEQTRVAQKIIELAQLDRPQTVLPHGYPIPAQRLVVFNDKLKRLQLRASLENVLTGYGTLQNLAHIFSPEDLAWDPLPEVSESPGGRLVGGERLTSFKIIPRFTPLKTTSTPWDEDPSEMEEAEMGEGDSDHELNRPRFYDSEGYSNYSDGEPCYDDEDEKAEDV